MTSFLVHCRERAAYASLALALTCAVLTAGCSNRLTHQSEVIDNKSRVTLLDAWILAHTPELLQVKFSYDGLDPNFTYNLRATLHTDRNGPGRSGGWIKQVPIPSTKASNRVETIWEFLSFPRESPAIYLRLEFADKESGLTRSVDFKLPGARHLRIRKMGSQ